MESVEIALMTVNAQMAEYVLKISALYAILVTIGAVEGRKGDVYKMRLELTHVQIAKQIMIVIQLTLNAEQMVNVIIIHALTTHNVM